LLRLAKQEVSELVTSVNYNSRSCFLCKTPGFPSSKALGSNVQHNHQRKNDSCCESDTSTPILPKERAAGVVFVKSKSISPSSFRLFKILTVTQNIHITAWGPLTINRAKKLNVTSDPALLKIAQSINITPTQLALSWAVQRGTSVIPKSSNEERLCSNFKSMCSCVQCC
jgi:hypothetical protein